MKRMRLKKKFRNEGEFFPKFADGKYLYGYYKKRKKYRHKGRNPIKIGEIGVYLIVLSIPIMFWLCVRVNIALLLYYQYVLYLTLKYVVWG